MGNKLLPHVLFLAMTVMLAACGGGEDGSTNTGPTPTGTTSTSPPPSGSTDPSPSPTPTPAPSTASLTLRWTANAEPDLAGYKIYGATSSGAYGAAVATVPANATSFVATGLQPGVTYFFVITAFDTAGNESTRSAEVTATASL